jgi:hypothetical protein
VNSFDGVSDRDAVGDNRGFLNMQDYYVKDAFLVFRTLCKLSMKPLGTERSVYPARIDHSAFKTSVLMNLCFFNDDDDDQ